MKNSKILLLLVMIIFSLVSCTKENIEEPEIIDPIIEIPITETSNNPLVAQVSSSSDDFLDLGCFAIEMPFDLTIDGEVSTIGSVEDFEDALTNAGETADIDFVYPIDITYEDGETASIASGEELGAAFSVCVPDDGWNDIEGGFPAYVINEENSCYTLLYPLTLTDLEGVETVVEDEATFIDALANNPLLFFTFPLILVTEDGEEVMAQDDEELLNLFFDCEGTHPPCDSVAFGFGTIACYDVVFPINVLVVDVDGNTSMVTLESEDDFNSTLLTGNVVGFDFPITVTDLEGTEVVINSEEEFETAISDCFGFGGEPDILTLGFLANETSLDGNCYAIQFPVSFTSPNGGLIIVAANAQEALDAVISNQFNLVPVYPVSIIAAGTSNTITLENEEDLVDLLDSCE